MAAVKSTGGTSPDLEADIRQLKADIEKLTRQLAQTGEHGYGAARRAAGEGIETRVEAVGKAVTVRQSPARLAITLLDAEARSRALLEALRIELARVDVERPEQPAREPRQALLQANTK